MAFTTRLIDQGKFGHKTRVNLVGITPDSSWASGGEAITANEVGLGTILSLEIIPENGLFPFYNSTTGVIDLNNVGGTRVQQTTVSKATLTDGGAAAGTQTLASLPAGSLVLGWVFVVGTPFTGDTSAVIKVGIAADDDRFSAQTTGSIFGAGSVGSAPLAADAHDAPGAVIAPFVTVTSAADFTNVVAGATGEMYLTYIPGGLAAQDLSGVEFIARAIGY